MKKYLILLSFFLTSCMATQRDMMILQSQIDDLNSNIFTLKKNQADLSYKIEELNKNLSTFSENTKYLGDKINKLDKKIDEYTELTDKKINQIGKKIETSPVKNEELKEKEMFFDAVSSFYSKKYELATKQFKDFILSYPKSENIDSTYFYLAESLFNQKSYKEAAVFYAKIINGYPNFEKINYVKYKYAKSLVMLNDKDKIKEAKIYLDIIIKTSKYSDEANLARELLKKINKK